MYDLCLIYVYTRLTWKKWCVSGRDTLWGM